MSEPKPCSRSTPLTQPPTTLRLIIGRSLRAALTLLFCIPFSDAAPTPQQTNPDLSPREANTTTRHWQSASPPAPLLELYTSQGCSSCPPAEKWLNRFTAHEELWSEVIPINFRVDYWDYLGWKDPYARAEFSQRQRQYQRLGASRQVATPGFIVAGAGWNGWFFGQALPERRLETPPAPLKVALDDYSLSAHWRAPASVANTVYLHVARLGFGLVDHIGAGENRGRILEQDFVVTAYTQSAMHYDDKTAEWTQSTTIPLRELRPERNDQGEALVIWLSADAHPRPLVTLANWLTAPAQH